MALGDVSIIGPSGQNLPSALKWPVAAAATTINAGEPAKLSSTYAIPSADAEPASGSPTFLGIASSTSNQTASVDGTVDIYPCVPGLVYACKTTSATAMNTAAKIQALIGTTCVFDLTSSVYTVDTATTGATDGLLIVGGDAANSIAYFMIRLSCSVFA